MPVIKTANSADETHVIQILVRAFSSDPAARWVWPDSDLYNNSFPDFVRAFGGKAFSFGSAYYIDGYFGTALWLPPNIHPDEEAMEKVLHSTVSEQILADVFGVFGQMANFHPAEPHWYLPLLGVDPIHHGKGFGSALMSHVLEVCDKENKIAYLESSNPKNIPFYKRHGFELAGTIQRGPSPTIFPMVRKPT